jgi:hypothetical protein
MTAEQDRALAVYTNPRFVAETARWARYLARDGAALAEDLGAGQLPPIPAIIVSAGYHRPKSAVRRAHQQLAAWIPDAELQIWDGAPHPLHIQQPDRVADSVIALLEHATGHQKTRTYGKPCPTDALRRFGPPRVFRTAELELFHAARCQFRYSS